MTISPVSRRVLLAALGALPLAACSTNGPGPGAASSGSAAPGGRTVVDSSGATVSLPVQVGRVADAWQAHNEVVAMLGAGQKVVATVSSQQLVPWLYTVNPHMSDAPTVFTNTGADVERLLATRPDVVFLPQGSKVGDALKDVQIPVVQLNFTDYEGLKKVVTITGEVLGGDAPARAKQYTAELTDVLSRVQGRTQSLAESQRPSVLHLTSLQPLVVDGTKTIVDAWIRAAGGRNAATVSGNNVTVGLEQLISWNPDVVIMGTNTLVDPNDPGSAVSKLLADPAWANVAAVQHKRVDLNPIGAFFWDRYSAEGVLQVQWAAKLLHPELFADLDLAAETKAFYRTYFGYALTDDQASRILTARRPA